MGNFSQPSSLFSSHTSKSPGVFSGSFRFIIEKLYITVYLSVLLVYDITAFKLIEYFYFSI